MKTYKETITKYYKYQYSDYALPKMTSVNAPKGLVEYDVSITGNGSQLYPMFFSGSSITIDCHRSNTSTSRYIKYTFEKLLVKGKYTLSYAGFRQQNVSMTQNQWKVIYEDGTSINIMSDIFSTATQTFSTIFTAEKPIEAIQLNIIAYSASDQYCNMSITNVSLTAEGYATNNVKVISATIESSSSNYDYYTDVDVYKVPFINGKYYAYSKVGRLKDSNGTIPDAPVVPDTPIEPDVPTEPVTLVGNTKIEDGVLSGFDADSYAIINYTLPNDLTQHEFEIVVEFTFETLDVSKTVTAILDTNKDKSLCGWGLGVRKGALWYCSGNGETSSYVNRSDYYGLGNYNYKIAITNKGYSQPKVMVTNLASNQTYDYGNMPTADVIHGVIALGMAGSDLGSAIANSAVEALCGTFNLANCYIEIDGVKVWEGVKTS